VTAQIQSSPTTEILALLARQRSAATYEGHMLSTLQNRLALLEQDVLITLGLPGAQFASLLFQGGWIVHAQWQQTIGAQALETISAQAPQAELRAIPLAPASAALAFAAIGGRALDSAALQRLDPDEQQSQLRSGQFSGVLASRTRANVGLWHFVQGRVTAHTDLPEGSDFYPSLLLAWEQRPLARLNSLSELPNLPSAAPQGTQSAQTLHTPAPTPTAGPDREDAAIWALFQATAQEHLGAASARLIALMQSKYGSEHGAALRESLGKQVDRLASKKAGQQFRSQPLTIAAPVRNPTTWSPHE
jgi:hypothetical protein